MYAVGVAYVASPYMRPPLVLPHTQRVVQYQPVFGSVTETPFWVVQADAYAGVADSATVPVMSVTIVVSVTTILRTIIHPLFARRADLAGAAYGRPPTVD